MARITNLTFLAIAFTLLTNSLSALTPNQAAVADQVNSVAVPSGDLAAVVEALGGIPKFEIYETWDTLAGEQYTTMMPANHYVTRRFIHHLYNAIDSAWNQTIRWPDCLNIDGWALGGGGRAFLDGDSSAEGYKSDYWDISLGCQTLLTPCLLVGIAGNYAQDLLLLNQGGRTTWKNGQGALYGAFHTDYFYLLADVIGGGSVTRLKRPIAIGEISRKAESHPKIWQGTFYGEVGADFNFCEFMCQPFCGVEVGYYKSKKIQESGADSMNLIVAGKSTHTLNTSLGVHLTYDCDAILIRGDAAWLHDFGSLTSNVTNQFQSFGAPFTVKGSKQGNDGVWGVLNMSTNTADIFNLYAELTGEIWEHWSAYGFDMGFSFQF
ncbi:MAG: autotransporter outer membrane beta-barrel domain-containing protein [Parachlamydiaceae bacterium]